MPFRQRPTFASFMLYFFFCGVSWTGMYHEYLEFDQFINLRGDYRSIPRSRLWKPAFKRFA